jgi:hypothetical protein
MIPPRPGRVRCLGAGASTFPSKFQRLVCRLSAVALLVLKRAYKKIFADATINQPTNTPVAAPNNIFSTTPGADIYMYMFSSQSAFQSSAEPIQEKSYNMSGSQAMHFGEQIASLKVVGYVGTSGGHLVS